MGSAWRFLSSLARMRKYVGDRRRSPRRGARFAARLPASISPLGDAQDFDRDTRYSLAGSTRDLSARGLTLLLPAVRVGDRYLTDAAGYLGVRVETPSGPLCLLAAPARFEQLPEGDGEYAYLLGVRIVRMDDGDRANYLSYLRTLAPRERRAEGRGRGVVDPPPAAGVWPDVTPSSVAEAFERFLRNNAHT
jgi:hypothetical protein